MAHGTAQPRASLLHLLDEISEHRNGHLRSSRRRGGPAIRNEVGDGHVDLVPDSGDDRRTGGEDRASDGLRIEGPEVLETAASPTEDDQVGPELIGAAERLHDLAGSLAPLHGGRADHDSHGTTAMQHPDDVPQRRAGRRGDDGNQAWQLRQRLLPLGIEEPFTLELALELLKS